MPDRLAKGADLRFVVEDVNGRMPKRVELQLAELGSNRLVETWSMTRNGKQVILDRNNVRKGFRYRAIGG